MTCPCCVIICICQNLVLRQYKSAFHHAHDKLHSAGILSFANMQRRVKSDQRQRYKGNTYKITAETH